MQYKITIPADYNMEVIRKRVRNNGSKTDGFPGLKYKFYLIQEKDVDSFEHVYAPLYLWEQEKGMNKFLFEGSYDNIIEAFGWQHVNIGIPLFMDFREDFLKSRYVLETTGSIEPGLSLGNVQETIKGVAEEEREITAQVCIYNPDKWIYSLFSFRKEHPQYLGNQNIYQILHISYGGSIRE